MFYDEYYSIQKPSLHFFFVLLTLSPRCSAVLSFITTNRILLFLFRLITEILKKISMDCVAIAFDKLSNWMPLSELSERKETVQPAMEEDDDDCIALE